MKSKNISGEPEKLYFYLSFKCGIFVFELSQTHCI